MSTITHYHKDVTLARTVPPIPFISTGKCEEHLPPVDH